MIELLLLLLVVVLLGVDDVQASALITSAAIANTLLHAYIMRGGVTNSQSAPIHLVAKHRLS